MNKSRPLTPAMRDVLEFMNSEEMSYRYKLGWLTYHDVMHAVPGAGSSTLNALRKAGLVENDIIWWRITNAGRVAISPKEVSPDA